MKILSKKTIFSVALLLTLTMAMLNFMPNNNISAANAQAVSTVPSNLLQYEWLGMQANQYSHFSAGPAPSSPYVLWQATMTSPGGYPVGFNGMLFVTQGNNITAYDPYTGNIIYNIVVPPALTGRTTSAAYVTKLDNTHMLAISTSAAVVTANKTTPAVWAFRGFNIVDGSLIWSLPAQTGVTSRFSFEPDTKMVYINVGNTTGSGGTQNPGSIQAWKFSDTGQIPTLAWTYIMFGGISSHSVGLYGDGKIYPGCNEPHQVALDALTGKVVWDLDLNGLPYYGGSYENGVLYKGCLDNTFVAINTTTGKIMWSYNPHDYGFWSSATALGYGMVYELNVDGYMYALNAQTGQVVWKYMGPGQCYPGSTEVADGKVYACTGQNAPSPVTGMGKSEYTCFDAYTGKVIWQMSREFGAGPTDSNCIAFGNLYGIEKLDANGNPVDSNVASAAQPVAKTVLYCYSSLESWPMFGGNPAHTAIGYGGPMNLSLSWKTQTGGAIVSSPIAVNGKIYVGSDDQNWYCFDASTGAKIWNFSVGASIRSSAAVVNGKVYTGADDGFFYCLDANTGTQIWKLAAPGQIVPIMTGTYPQYTSSPIIVNNRVYVGSFDAKLYCLDPDRGTPIWTLTTSSAIISTPTFIAGDGLYCASVDGYVYKVNPDNGNVIWNVSTPIGLELAMESTPIVANGLVVIGSGAAKNSPAGIGQMYALNATNGQMVWKNSMQTTSGNMQPIWTALYLNNPALGPVFYYADNFNLDCVNAKNGSLIWTTFLTREHFGQPAYADGKIYVGSATFGPYVVDANTGKKLAYIDAGGEVEGSIAIYQNRMYFGSFDGNLYCVEQASSGTLDYGPFITVQTDKTQVNANDPITISGTISPMPPNASATVTLFKPDSTYTNIPATLSNTGAFTATYQAGMVGTWQISTSFTGKTPAGYEVNGNSPTVSIDVSAMPSPTPIVTTEPTPIPTVQPTPVVTSTPEPVMTPTPTPVSAGFTLDTTAYAAIGVVVVVAIVAAIALVLRKRK